MLEFSGVKAHAGGGDVAWLMPAFRQTSATAEPSSAKHRIKDICETSAIRRRYRLPGARHVGDGPSDMETFDRGRIRGSTLNRLQRDRSRSHASTHAATIVSHRVSFASGVAPTFARSLEVVVLHSLK
jgi:hypothetical protein